MKASQTLRATIALLVLTTCVPTALARTWLIHEDGSGDAPTIQAAIDSSSTGDTLRVGPGTYAEDIDYLGKDIVLESIPRLAATIVGTGTSSSGTVVTLTHGETRAATLRGFLIKGPYAAILALNASPTIEENNFEAFSCGAIYCGATGISRKVLIKGNTIRSNYGGPAIEIAGNQVPEITNNLIRDNENGGIWISASAPGGSVVSNTIIGNQFNFGGGLHAEWNGAPGASNYTIAWNLFIGNQLKPAAFKDPRVLGSGIYLKGTGAWVHHNTFAANGNMLSARESGVIMLDGETGTILSQNIVAFNPWGTGIVCENSANVQMRNNLLWENQPADLGAQCVPFWTDDGNLVADPAFCDPENGDYSLAQNSPAITHEAGPLGAIPIPGCGPVAVRPSTWGRIKSMYGQ